MTPRHSPLLHVLFSVIVLSSPAWAQSDPATLPARDSHEGLLVAADTYTDEARSKQKFGKKHPQAAGILAIEVIFRNENEHPILVRTQTIELLLEAFGQRPQRLAALALDDVINLMLEEKLPGKVRSKPFPERVPNRRSKDWRKLEEVIAPLALDVSVLPPQSTMRGFLFFDLDGRFDFLARTKLYIPDLEFMHTRKPLMFFEVDLAAAVKK